MQNRLSRDPDPIEAGMQILSSRPKHHSRSTAIASTALKVLLSFNSILSYIRVIEDERFNGFVDDLTDHHFFSALVVLANLHFGLVRLVGAVVAVNRAEFAGHLKVQTTQFIAKFCNAATLKTLLFEVEIELPDDELARKKCLDVLAKKVLTFFRVLYDV